MIVAETPPLSRLAGQVWPAVVDPASAAILAVARQLEHTQWWSPERLRTMQLRQAAKLIDWAFRTSPFYRERVREAAKLGDGLTAEGLDAVPPMTRDELQRNTDSIRSRAPLRDRGTPTESSTSGSSGRPVTTLWDAAASVVSHAFAHRLYRWHRRDPAGKFAAIRILAQTGSPEPTAPTGWLPGYATGAHLALDVAVPLDRQLDWLAATAPDYLLTYPTNLACLAERAAARGLRLPSLKGTHAFGETVGDEQREIVRTGLGVEIVDAYSAQELGAIAQQCPDFATLHVASENAIVEIVDDAGRHCAPGETGRVVLTALHIFASPLIRYDIGDYAELGEPCPCGRGLPTLKRIVGRARNMLVLPNGERRWPKFQSGYLRGFAPIRQFQMVQTSGERIEARLVVERALSAAEEERLREAILAGLGHRFQIDFAYCDAIPRQAGGKFEDFRCEIA